MCFSSPPAGQTIMFFHRNPAPEFLNVRFLNQGTGCIIIIINIDNNNNIIIIIIIIGWAGRQELYEKFMCYCQSGGSDLGASISAAEGKAPESVLRYYTYVACVIHIIYTIVMFMILLYVLFC